MTLKSLVLLALMQICIIGNASSFMISDRSFQQRSITARPMTTEQNNGQKEGGIFSGVSEFFGNLDSIADDFFYKRMGKGEIFYGKRKFNPSGDVEGDYQGMGLSDKGKIDMAREYREEWLEEKRMRDEIRQLKEDFEKRNSQ